MGKQRGGTGRQVRSIDRERPLGLMVVVPLVAAVVVTFVIVVVIDMTPSGGPPAA